MVVVEVDEVVVVEVVELEVVVVEEVVVVDGTVGAVSLFGATPPKEVQVPDTHRWVEPISLSTIKAGDRPVSSRLNETNPSLYVPLIEIS